MSVFRDWDYNKQDIAKNSGLSPRHATIALEKLEKLELIKKTRNIGNSQMYKYNTENPVAMMLKKFSLDLAFQECQKIANQEDTKTAVENQQIETSPNPHFLEDRSIPHRPYF